MKLQKKDAAVTSITAEPTVLPPPPMGAGNPQTPWIVAVKVPLAWVGISGMLTSLFAAMLIYTISIYLLMLLLTAVLIGVLAGVVAQLSGVDWRRALFVIGLPVSVLEGGFIALMPGWAAAITAGVAMSLIVWFIKLETVALPALENYYGRNLDTRPGIQEVQEHHHHHYSLYIDEGKAGGRWGANFDLPEGVKRERAIALYKRFLQGYTSEADNYIYRTELRKIRGEIIFPAKLGDWKAGQKNQSFELNAAGRAFCKREIAEWEHELTGNRFGPGEEEEGEDGEGEGDE